jgi:Fe-S-cluster-containing dehydrogenase component
MTFDRREFLCGGMGAAAGGAACAVLDPSPAEARENLTVPENAAGLLYDSTLCTGCKACQSACKNANTLPMEDTVGGNIWETPLELSSKTFTVIKAYKEGRAELKDQVVDGYAFIKRQCLHCIDPSCVSVCPVQAMRKDPVSGIVTHNPDACIGCRYCVAACPYRVPQFSYDTPFPRITKCQLCKEHLAKGDIPGCAKVCPTGATLFGDYKNLTVEIERRKAMKPGELNKFPRRTLDSGDVQERPAASYIEQVYGEKELGGTQVRYLAGIPFEKFGLPVGMPERSYAADSETLQHKLYAGLLAPIAILAGLVTAAFRSVKHQHEDGGHHE